MSIEKTYNELVEASGHLTVPTEIDFGDSIHRVVNLIADETGVSVIVERHDLASAARDVYSANFLFPVAEKVVDNQEKSDTMSQQTQKKSTSRRNTAAVTEEISVENKEI